MICLDEECDCPCHDGPDDADAIDWLKRISEKWLDDRDRIAPSQQFGWLMQDMKRWLDSDES